MSFVNEQGVQPLVQYAVPVRGTWNSVAAHTVPADAVYKSMNVFVREGKLRNRPGLTLFNDFEFDNAILGGGLAVTPDDKKVLAISARHLYEFGENATTWVDRDEFIFAKSNNTRVDIAFLETSSMYVALIGNDQFPLRQWTELGGPTSITASTGVVPLAKSVCIAGRRVVVLTPPHTIQWSAVFDHTAWPADGINRLAQTGDMGICVRSLSALSFVLYKERSIHIARSQAGGDASAFSFAEPIRVEGPAGVYAVVEVGGTHFYMTKNGRIAAFNGSTYPKWIADGVWLYLQRDINPAHAHMIFGVYDHRLHTITFYYPRSGVGDQLRGMVIINLPLEGLDLEGAMPTSPYSFLGESGVPCTFGCEMRFADSIDRSLLFSSVSGDCQSFISDEESSLDDEEVYECFVQTGLVSVQNAQHGMMTFETFVERGIGYGTLIVEPVVSDGLEVKDGIVPDMKGKVIDLNYNPVRKYEGFNVNTRFFGLRYSWNSTNRVRYAGAVVYARITA